MDLAPERRALLAALRAGPPTVTHARKVARGWVRAHPGVLAYDVHPLLDALWRAREGGRVLACELMRSRPQLAVLLPKVTLDRWRRDLDDARTTDALAVAGVGFWVAAYPSRLAYLDSLARSRSPWSRRAAAAATTALRHHPPEAVLAVVDRLASDPEPVVRNALRAALRALAERHPRAVRAYVRSRREVLPAALVRQVRPRG